MEAGTTAPGPLEDLGADLDRIAAAVGAGGLDLRGLGFWRVVALIKREIDLPRPRDYHVMASKDALAYVETIRTHFALDAARPPLS